RSTVSVDLSNTYLDWARKNFSLNGVTGARHQLVRADVSAWLAETRDAFDLVFVAPPTFSSSKSMRGTFDLQRDHVALITDVARRLAPGGVILFSNHFRRFKMDAASLDGLAIEEITRRTLPPDFARDRRTHNSWRITRK